MTQKESKRVALNCILCKKLLCFCLDTLYFIYIDKHIGMINVTSHTDARTGFIGSKISLYRSK